MQELTPCDNGQPARRKFGFRSKQTDMAETDVIANQQSILENQKSILANQEEIKQNQELIRKNQEKLDTIISNQEQILTFLKAGK